MGGMRVVCLGCSAASNGSFTAVYFSGPPYYYHFIYFTINFVLILRFQQKDH
ncbi:hypothetical protein PR002_g32405 [Phytophthora rubi]|uniref:Uncharacterized protein n=1 Tax=Phytophthora rubi TaxID=129364 RepID=A0A6A3GHT3_9STRA|nr:hypothetical protein PR002_g32405 [Phytophthora rubi]